MSRWEDPRRVLERHGRAPKKSFSQNFLVSRTHAERIAAFAARAKLPVLELGPGVGTLTALLLDAGARVHAVERDRDMLDVLAQEFQNEPSLSVVEGDAVTFDIGAWAKEMGGKVVVTGNLPYAVTGGIFRNLGTHHAVIHEAFVMVQREVRDRLVSEPGSKSYGALTVFTRAVFTPSAALELSPGCFHPPPKVASSVVRLAQREEPVAITRTFERVVGAAFQARRKTLRNALQLVGPVSLVDHALERSAIDGRRRGETLSIAEFSSLTAHWDAGERGLTPLP